MAVAAGFGHPDFMRRALTPEQYLDHVERWTSQPRGDARQDVYNTLLRWQVGTVLGAKISPEQMMPPWHERDTDDMSAEELYQYLEDQNRGGSEHIEV